MRHHRRAKIVATLGPASSDPRTIQELFAAGVDVFRLNFSHGTRHDHAVRVATLRQLEEAEGRPIGILAGLQGPKLRVGAFKDGAVHLQADQEFVLDSDTRLGNAARVHLPHPEIFAALLPGSELLLDDGKLRLQVVRCDLEHAVTRVLVGGRLSDRKGVNVPGVVLPISALTPKDHADLHAALELGVDWVALSFVQRPQDVAEAREIIGNRARIVAKLEKPSAIDALEAVIEQADAVMVARGDLGVEMPAERVPAIQKRIVRACRRLGKPVIVATQMLESMIDTPVPTRAEASDVATAIYDGADAVMLSAESASGKHPVAAVAMMHRIIQETEADPLYRQLLEASHVKAPTGNSTTAQAICCAMRHAVSLVDAAAIVCYTSAGPTSLRAARERPAAPIVSLTPSVSAARRLALVWGVHSVHVPDVADVDQSTETACAVVVREQIASAGQTIVIVAGMPFGKAGTTNLLRIATV
ncbi:MAG: pyruvate kinase [Variovorax paradoxus]|nr:MAG: pyruvate kinase [Variovorax paradoxus]PZQ05469.1 MAG: pyruvate kinase [Variovorax paradoxus]